MKVRCCSYDVLKEANCRSSTTCSPTHQRSMNDAYTKITGCDADIFSKCPIDDGCLAGGDEGWGHSDCVDTSG
jgi:hypothetical protein